MKHFIFTLIGLVAFTCTGFGQQARHVVLITIDGFRPEFYLDPSYGAVNMRQMMEKGTHAKGVKGIFPTVTFPSHTTIVTGVKPVKHGIYYNTPFEPLGATGRWYWDYEAIKSPTLWTAIRQQGLTSASVLWPVTVGAPIDYNIPDVWSLGSADRREATSKSATPAGLWQELELHATGKMEANDFNMDKDYQVMDENVARMAGYLIRKHKPNLVTVHLPVVDHAEHADGRDGEKVRRAVAGADRAIRTLVEAVDKAGISAQTAFIITGDHGFVNRHTLVSPNVWLAKAGILTDVKKDQWKAQFLGSGGSAFLYLKDKKDKKTVKQVKELLAALPAEQQKFFRVLEGKELASSGADPAVALALAAAPGYAFGGAATGEVMKKTSGGTHGYFPDFADIQTGFIGFGAGFKKGTSLPVMEMLDMAPLAAKLLGLSFPTAEGKLHPEILAE
ncbi:MAG: alkaline phosphatase family protein [Adhaeribacter sp.]